MQGTWTNITGGTKGSFSIFNIPDVSVSSGDAGGDVASPANAEMELLLSVEKSALLNFFSACHGTLWKESLKWCSEAPVSEWYGIETHKPSGLVKRLILKDNNLVGTLEDLVPHIRALRNLEELWLQGNSLSGPVPKLLATSNSTLKKLDLSRNGLTGTIPKDFSLNSTLIWLDLSRNGLRIFYKFDKTANPQVDIHCETTAHDDKSIPPPRHLLQSVYTTAKILSDKECESIVDMAENHASISGGWLTERHQKYKTTDIDVRHAPLLLDLCNKKLEESIIPALSGIFKLPLHVLDIDDLFVVKYEHKCNLSDESNGVFQTSLAPHRDDSVVSFVILLNDGDSFDGGGTEFVDFRPPYIAAPRDRGTMVSFCGLQRHSGKQITRGKRYILAGFVRIDDKGMMKKKGQELFLDDC